MTLRISDFGFRIGDFGMKEGKAENPASLVNSERLG